MRLYNFIKLFYVVLFVLLTTLANAQNFEFIGVENGQFTRNGNPYYFVGTNFWYGAILGSQGEGGNRDRLVKELDALKSIGVTNLRVLVGGDGGSAVSKIEPSLQLTPGVYEPSLLEGLDFLMVEMGKREMDAVLYLNNSWEWSGGYGQYLEWADHGKAPIPAVDGFESFRKYVSQFVNSPKAMSIFADHVKYIIGRTNSISGVKYVDDPTIFSWQIGNEPRAFSSENKKAFTKWIASVASQIKTLDSNHLVSIGSEGEMGCEGDLELWEQIHNDDNIDYATFHIWPKNWSWIDMDNIAEGVPTAIKNSEDYITRHIEVAKRLNQPLVLEEFGFPRNDGSTNTSISTSCRDTYYDSIFKIILKAKAENGNLAGCNFWSWGGLGKATSDTWQLGSDYLGDPAQEPQGLNSVFMTDKKTTKLIKKTNKNLF